MNNLLTDIAGVRVGHADDAALASGVTAVIFDKPAVASMDVRGGGPGTREGSLLDLVNVVEQIDAITLSGGSAFGLEAGGGVQAWLAEQGRGFRVREALVPIAPGAICFDLLNGGNKQWGRFAPYRDLGYAAAAAAKAGLEGLRPIKDQLPERIVYGPIRFVVGFILVLARVSPLFLLAPAQFFLQRREPLACHRDLVHDA